MTLTQIGLEMMLGSKQELNVIAPAHCRIDFVPTATPVDAQIVTLTPAMVEASISSLWWSDESLKLHIFPAPIDREWDWSEIEIENEGRVLHSELVGVVTADSYVQGAMLISREPVKSHLDSYAQVLFVELLFTAPRNRSALRQDGRKLFGGVGSELLRWGAGFSQTLGFDGRLALHGSPDYLKWYQIFGFQILPIEPVIYEEIQYTPMELGLEAAKRLLLTRDD